MPNTKTPSHRDAVKSFDIALRWFEEQEEFNLTQFHCLRRIRDLAANKEFAKLKQTCLTDFFK